MQSEATSPHTGAASPLNLSDEQIRNIGREAARTLLSNFAFQLWEAQALVQTTATALRRHIGDDGDWPANVPEFFRVLEAAARTINDVACKLTDSEAARDLAIEPAAAARLIEEQDNEV